MTCMFRRPPNSCAHSVSSLPRSHILKAGGKILTFEQIALDTPKDCSTILLSGLCKGEEIYRHFGKTPEIPHCHTKPYLNVKGQKFQHTEADGRATRQKLTPLLLLKRFLDAGAGIKQKKSGSLA